MCKKTFVMYMFVMFGMAMKSNNNFYDNMLLPCENKWNCVITQEAKGKKSNIEPIRYNGSQAQAVQHLKDVLLSFDRVELIAATDEYLHVTFTTKWLSFIDDVECYAPKDEKVIYIRSASRVGKYDFGVNRRRIHAIKNRFYKR